MGLVIHFSLALPDTRDPAMAATQLARLRLAAEGFPFHFISPIWRLRRWECRAGNGSELREPRERLRAAGRRLLQLEGRDVAVIQPEEIQGFVIEVGRRCDPLLLGLARYPLVVDFRGRTFPTGLFGWHWQAHCSTQRASLCGLEYFVRCHQAVIALLDRARAIGFTSTVQDESGYREHRDVTQLLAAVEQSHRGWARLYRALAPGGGGPGLLDGAGTR